MGRTSRQTWQIVNQNPLTVLETNSRERLDNLNTILDSKLDYPFRVTLSESLLTIRGSEIQTVKSDGNDGFENSFKISSSPIQGLYKKIPQSSINFFTGETTGPFSEINDAPNMDPNNYIWAGIELREDGKFYLYWGEQSQTIEGATYPLFKTGDSICLILLQGFSSGGFWKFNNPNPENVILFKESNALEIREDVVHKARVIDLVSNTLPTGGSIIIDGESIVENDLVLFTKSAIEGLYRAKFSAGSVSWEKILQPISGSNVQITSGTLYLRTIWKRVQGIWAPLEIAEAVKEPTGFPNRTDSTFSFDNSTRTFTLRPVSEYFDYFIKGNVWRVASPISITIPNTVGDHFIYLDGNINPDSGNYLHSLTTFDNYLLTEKAYVAYIYWSGSEAIILGDERHGLSMSGATHRYLHLSVGTVLQSGLDLGLFTETGTGNLNADAQITMANALLFDEDIDIRVRHTAEPQDFFNLENPDPTKFHEQVLTKSFESDGVTVKHPSAKIPVYYKTGEDGHWEKDVATYYPFKVDSLSGLISLNRFNSIAGEWETISATSENYVTYWIFATNSVTEPIIAIMGQFQYDTLSEAQEKETYQELDTQLFPVKEFKLCYRLIFQTNSTFGNDVKTALRHVQDLRISPDTPFASVSVKDHGLLTGLEDPDHAPTAVTTFGVVKDGGLSASDVDAKNVFDTVNKLFGQLRILEHPTNKNRVRITGADRILNNNTKLSQAIGSLLLSFDGAEIDFALNKIIYTDPDREEVDFVRPEIANNVYHWFSISLATNVLEANNTLSGQIIVVPGSEGNLDKDLAPKAVFSAGLKLGQVYLKGAGGFSINNILQENIIQLGVGSGGGGGDGTGDANELLERLKNIFDKSEYEFMTPNIFSISGSSEIDSATAEFSIVSSNYVYKQIGNNIVSKNVLDEEYTSQSIGFLKDINNIDFYAFYDIENFDPDATFEVSRADGYEGTWQTFYPRRIGNSDTYYSSYTFQEENIFPYTINAQSGGVPETFNFEGNSNSVYFREFSVDSPSVIKKINTSIGVTGTPLGSLSCKIVKNDTGTNLLKYSEDFNNATWVKTRSSVLANIEIAPDGTLTADKIMEDNSTSTTHIATQNNISFTSGVTYTYSIYAKADGRNFIFINFVTGAFGATTGAYFDLSNGTVGQLFNGATATIKEVTGYPFWYKISITATATATASSQVVVQLSSTSVSGGINYTGDGVSGIFVWGAKLEIGSKSTNYSSSPVVFNGRSSLGSFIGSDGLVRYATSDIARNNYTSSNLNLAPKLLLEESRTNILIYTEDFNNAAWTKIRINVLENVEVSPDGSWTADKIIETIDSGTHVCVENGISYVSGNYYSMSIFAKAAERSVIELNFPDANFLGSANAIFDLSNGTIASIATSSFAKIFNMGNGWYRCCLIALCDTSGSGSADVAQIRQSSSGSSSYVGDGVSGLYIWGAQLEVGSYPTSYIPSNNTFTSRASTATYVDVTGTIKTASNNIARINYNPSNLSLPAKLLLEESRQNLSLNSADFANASWSKVRSSISSNQVLAPDGTLTADKLVEDTSSGTHYTNNTVSFVSGNVYTFSVFVKSAERSSVSIRFDSPAAGSNDVTANLATGVITNKSGTALNATIQKFPDGWYRISTTAIATATLSENCIVYLHNGSSTSYTGNGVSGLYVWGSQTEIGYYPTSYIPTTSSAITRSADVSSSIATTRSEDLSTSTPEIPFSNPNDLVAASNSLNLAGVAAGSKTFDMTAVLPKGDYFVVFETNDLYKSNYNLSSGNSRISGSLDSGLGIRCVLTGRNLSLKIRITGGTLDSALRGYGVFYNLLSNASLYSEGYQDFKVSFNGYTENLNEFTLPFVPEKRLIKVYEQNTGQVYKHGVFSISGNKVIFPLNTFYKPEQVTLIFEQLNIVNFSLPLTTDKAYALMIENNLGSTNPNLDASANGRGIFLRRPDGTLREITIDNEDNIVIYSV